MSATPGVVPLEMAAFGIGPVEEVGFVQEKKQILPGQNYYDGVEHWSDVWRELGCDSRHWHCGRLNYQRQALKDGRSAGHRESLRVTRWLVDEPVVTSVAALMLIPGKMMYALKES